MIIWYDDRYPAYHMYKKQHLKISTQFNCRFYSWHHGCSHLPCSIHPVATAATGHVNFVSIPRWRSSWKDSHPLRIAMRDTSILAIIAPCWYNASQKKLFKLNCGETLVVTLDTSLYITIYHCMIYTYHVCLYIYIYISHIYMYMYTYYMHTS